MYIGKIVNASSHVDYVCQVYGPGEAEQIPAPLDYGFGAFIGIEQEDGGLLVGLIANTMLLNPEFGNLGPRLSPQDELAVFSPDYLAEQATLVAITVIGAMPAEGPVLQGVPPVSACIDARVRRLTDAEVRAFHVCGGRFQLGYMALLQGMQSNPLIPPLLLQVTHDLMGRFPEQASRLAILRCNLAWRAAVLPAG
jgi:hypothetical protein